LTVCRYFGAFQEDVLRSFYKTFEQWELEMVIQDLTNANILGQHATKTLSDSVHPAMVYRLVCNWTIFSDKRILSAIHTSSISHPLPGWPSDPLSPGMFILLMSDSPSVGQWAKNQASKCTTVPMSSDMFVGPYFHATELVIHALTLSGTGQLPDSALSSFSFASDPSRLWSGFSFLLRHLPVDVLASDTRQHTNLRRVITGHLHDTGPR
jgi:senataxin